MLVSIPIPNLIQGVSQQPPQMRLPSQASEQINAYSSPTEGLTKRPPTQFVGVLDTSIDASDYAFHWIDRDTSERYVVGVNGSTVKVWSLSGAAIPVYGQGVWQGSFPSTWSTYMSGAVKSNIKLLSIADYTFIVNKAKTVSTATTKSSVRNEEALVTVLQAAYSSTYNIHIRIGAGAEVTSSKTTSDNSPADIRTDSSIATALAAAINTSHSGTLTATRYGSTIYIKANSATTSFSVRVSDSNGDSMLVAAKGSVPRLSDLPLNGPNGFKIAVSPDPDVAGLAYWVEFKAGSGADAANGVWEETIAPDTFTSLSLSTMPFVLKRKTDVNNGIFFSIEEGPWVSRQVGDMETNPWPSFNGKTIQDIFFYKNRLGLLAGDKVVMSEAGQYFNFFKTTVTQTIDSDLIDIGTISTSVSTLRAAVPFGERVILFSDQAQFMLGTTNDEPLTPKTAASVLVTEYSSAAALCRPVSTGKSILFLQSDARYCGMREYYMLGQSNRAFEAIDLSANSNSYVEGSPFELTVSSYDNIAVVLTAQSTDPVTLPTVWTYKWMMNGNEKIQSAWSKWQFPESAGIFGANWFNKKLYLIVSRPNGLYLEYMDFEIRVPDASDFLPHLDCIVKLKSVVWDGGKSTGNTVVGSETMNPSAMDVVIVANGRQIYLLSKTASSVSSNVNVVGQNVYVGVPYEMSYTFSPVYMRQSGVPLLDGRLTLTYGSISFSETGFFSVDVEPTFRDSYAYLRDERTYEYFGGELSSSYITDVPNLPIGTFRFPIHAKSDDVSITVSSNSHYPIRLNAAMFEAHYVSRSRPS